MKIQTNLVIKNIEIFRIKRYLIIYCAVISGEYVWCRLRSFSDRQAFLLVRAIFTAYTCSPWESGIWYEGMPPGMALATREEEAGWEASRSFTFRPPGHHIQTRGQRPQPQDGFFTLASAPSLCPPIPIALRPHNGHQRQETTSRRPVHKRLKMNDQRGDERQGIQGCHFQTTWPEP